MIRKGRERLERGCLQKFEDLPKQRQEVFKNIKKILEIYFKKDLNVYVAGSHFYGYWDELSDYDVAIDEKDFDYLNLVSYIRTIDIKIHLVNIPQGPRNILII